MPPGHAVNCAPTVLPAPRLRRNGRAVVGRCEAYHRSYADRQQTSGCYGCAHCWPVPAPTTPAIATIGSLPGHGHVAGFRGAHEVGRGDAMTAVVLHPLLQANGFDHHAVADHHRDVAIPDTARSAGQVCIRHGGARQVWFTVLRKVLAALVFRYGCLSTCSCSRASCAEHLLFLQARCRVGIGRPARADRTQSR